MCRRRHFAPLTPPLVQLRLGPAGLIEVVSPFDAVTHAQLRAVRPPGRWLPRRGCWEFPFEAAAILERLLAGRFPRTPELERWLAWTRQPLPPLPHRQRRLQPAQRLWWHPPLLPSVVLRTSRAMCSCSVLARAATRQPFAPPIWA